MQSWRHSPFKSPPPHSSSLDDSLNSHASRTFLSRSAPSSPTPSARTEDSRTRSGSKSPFRFLVPSLSTEAERAECSLQFAERSLEDDMKAIRDELRQVRRMIGDLR
jgi:hypothetical protein